jgi:hypothetical protein
MYRSLRGAPTTLMEQHNKKYGVHDVWQTSKEGSLLAALWSAYGARLSAWRCWKQEQGCHDNAQLMKCNLPFSGAKTAKHAKRMNFSLHR